MRPVIFVCRMGTEWELRLKGIGSLHGKSIIDKVKSLRPAAMIQTATEFSAFFQTNDQAHAARRAAESEFYRLAEQPQ